MAAAAPPVATRSAASDGTIQAATAGARRGGSMRLPHSRQYSWPGSAGAPHVRHVGWCARSSMLSALRELADRCVRLRRLGCRLDLGRGVSLSLADRPGLGAQAAARAEGGVRSQRGSARSALAGRLAERATAGRAELRVG